MKNNIIYLIIGIVLVLFILNANFGLFSIILGGGFIDCGDIGTNKFSCSAAKGDVAGSLGKIRLQVREPDLIPKRMMLCEKLKYLTGVSCPSCPETMPTSTCQYILGQAYQSVLKEPLMIMKGKYSEIGGDKYTPIEGTFETYGLCDHSLQLCWVFDPFPDEHRYLHLNSMVVHYKEGGYFEDTLAEDVCSEFNICPEGINETINITDGNITCPAGFEYNEIIEKCEKFPDVSTICTVGTYNPSTDKCEVYPAITEFNLKRIWEEYKIAIIIVGILLFLLLISGRRN